MKTINKRVFVYFGEKRIISNPDEAIAFIKHLGFEPSNQNKETLQDAFSESPSQYTKNNFQISPTGIGRNHIEVYHSLADTLEQHELILAERQAEQKRIDDEKKKIREQEFLSEINSPLRGWYEVTIDHFVSDYNRGGHKSKTLHGRVIADSIQDAYNKGLKEIDDKNGFWAESINRAMINYIGVLTDEYLLNEY